MNLFPLFLRKIKNIKGVGREQEEKSSADVGKAATNNDKSHHRLFTCDYLTVIYYINSSLSLPLSLLNHSHISDRNGSFSQWQAERFSIRWRYAWICDPSSLLLIASVSSCFQGLKGSWCCDLILLCPVLFHYLYILVSVIRAFYICSFGYKVYILLLMKKLQNLDLCDFVKSTIYIYRDLFNFLILFWCE